MKDTASLLACTEISECKCSIFRPSGDKLQHRVERLSWDLTPREMRGGDARVVVAPDLARTLHL